MFYTAGTISLKKTIKTIASHATAGESGVGSGTMPEQAPPRNSGH